MIAEQLNRSILQAAVQGKLTQQLLEDGDAHDLLKEIKKEKARLIKECKNSKEEQFPEITEDEIPFDIPETWCWIRLGEVAVFQTGKLDSNAAVKDGKYPFFTCSKDVLSINSFSFDCEALLLAGNNAQGKYDVKHYKGKFDAYQRTYVIFPAVSETINLHFLKIFLEHKLKEFQKKSLGSLTKYLTIKIILPIVVPLPPLPEQKRIVEFVNKILPETNKLGGDESKLDVLQRAFPKKMKDSILQYAVEGKLTEQLESDGDARDLLKEIQKEKDRLVKEGKIRKDNPLPEITEDEIPFDIPENWCWVRLQDVFDVRDGTHSTPKYVVKGFPLITSKNIYNGKLDLTTVQYISEKDHMEISKRSKVEFGDIIFAMIGSIGNPVMVETESPFSIKNVALFKYYSKNLTDSNYLLYFLKYAEQKMNNISSGAVQSFVSLSFLRNYLFPLPPLAEQKRIAERLEELLPEIGKLEMKAQTFG